MQRSTRFFFGFLFAVGLLQVSACRENSEEAKAVRARVEEKVKDNGKGGRGTPDPLPQREVAPKTNPTVEAAVTKDGPRFRAPHVSVTAAAISPSGKYAVLAYKNAKDNSLRVWDVDQGKLLAASPRDEVRDYWVFYCSFLGNDDRFISVSHDGKAMLHKLTVKEKRAVVETIGTFWIHESGLNWPCAVSRDGKYMISAGMDHGYERSLTKIWDLEKMKVIRIFEEDLLEESEIGISLGISPDGSFALTAGVRAPPDGARHEGAIKLPGPHTDAKAPVKMAERKEEKRKIEICLLDVKKNKLVRTFARTDGWFFPIGFSGDGSAFVIGRGTADEAWGKFCLWDLSSMKVTRSFLPATNQPMGAILQNVPNTSVWLGRTRIRDATDPPPAVAFWDFQVDKEPKIVPLDNARFDRLTKSRIFLSATAISPSGEYALVASGYVEIGSVHSPGIEIHVWDLKTGALRGSWKDSPQQWDYSLDLGNSPKVRNR